MAKTAWLTGYLFRRKITATNGGAGTLTNANILITLDTATLIAQGKMLSTGFDIIICNETTNTKYNYWIESCFNTATTDIWFRVASLPTGQNSFYLYYGNSVATQPASWQTYTGSAIFMYSGSTPSGYGSLSTIVGVYPRCSGSYNTAAVAAANLAHTHTSNYTTSTGSAGVSGVADGEANPNATHTHTFTIASTSTTQLPSTLSLVFFTGSPYSGEYRRLTLDNYSVPNGAILLYSGSSAPSGWSQYTPLINKYFSGSTSTAILTTGSHTHMLSGNTSAPTNTTTAESHALPICYSTHVHAVNNPVDAAENDPSYITMLPITTTGNDIPINAICMFTLLPTYGWRRLTEADNRIPKCASSYGTVGSGHTHNVSITTSAKTADVTGHDLAPNTTLSPTHSHTITGATGAASDMPTLPSIDLIFAAKELNVSLTITLGSEEGGGQTIPTRGYTPYTPSYASAFAFIETPRTATCNATEWEIRLNSGNRLSSYRITVADRIGEFKNKVSKFDPIRIYVSDGPRFDMLIWGVIEDHDQIQQDSTTFTLSGRNLGAYASYRAANFNWYQTDVMNIFTSGETALSGSVPEVVWGSYIKSPNKSLTVLGEKRKALDVQTEIAQRVSDTSNTWINFVCAGEHPDEKRLPNFHFEIQQDIPSEVFLTPRDVIGYELLESSRSSIQKLQVEYAQSIISGSTFWLVSGSDFTFSSAIATGSMRTGSCDNTVEARTEKGTPFNLMRTNADYLYIGNQDRFWKLFVDMSGSGIYTGSNGVLSTVWEYSKFGTGSTNTGSWGIFTVADGTYGFNVDGEIAFNVPVDWATGSFTTGSSGYAPYQYWARVSTAGSYTTGSAYQILMANLYPSVWRSTGSESDPTKQYEYVYRGDILDSGSAITYADSVLSQVYEPVKVLRLVMRGSTYWRPTYTYYWRGYDLSGSGRYRIASCIHRRTLESYMTVLESSKLV